MLPTGILRSMNTADTPESQAARYPSGNRFLTVKEWPMSLQPREILDAAGPEHCPKDILLAVILRQGVKGLNVVDLARDLLHEYGSIAGIAARSTDELAGRRGMGRVKAQVLKASLELARRLAAEQLPVGHAIRTPQDVVEVLREQARPCEQEIVWVLLLDTKNRLRREPVEVSRGLVDCNLVHPREVFKEAIRSAATSIVLAHNHPSGDPQPSAQDLAVTRRLVAASKTIEIPVLDHVIVGRDSREGGQEYVSLRESGYIDFEKESA